MTTSFFRDFCMLLFAPKRFFNTRFMTLTSRRLFFMGFLGTSLGLLLGNIISLIFADAVMADFVANQDLYKNALSSLNINEQGFLELMRAQKSYSVLLAILSPLIAYMAPHIFGGALYIFLKLFVRPITATITFNRVLECSSAALTSMAWYIVPIFGPLIAISMVGINVSRALLEQYQLAGFMKVMSIVSAIYLSFFLSSASLQILAQEIKFPIKLF